MSLVFILCFLFVVITTAAVSHNDTKELNALDRLSLKLTTKWKISFVAFQILYTMPTVMPETSLPKAYEELVQSVEILTLDLSAALPLECFGMKTGSGAGALRKP